MSKSPSCCPLCGEQTKWILVDQSHKGFSVGKAAVVGLMFGKYGLIAGALGKRKSTYFCGKCGFHHEYNGK